ncbi:MAG: NADH-quinone oxidoreductase subunit C [Candidatus Marinimicrobia bacterium]|jgi:NADH-quinone oxidoreductase subunit C|nr:NADH-quinone oxidoreductase subunit C [Candidatus Neomarinimicrobiota bacterium]
MSLEKTISHVKERFSEAVLDVTEFAGEQIVHIKSGSVLDVLKIFKDEGFNFLANLTAVDNLTLGGFERFSVVYHLLSHGSVERVTVKAYVAEDDPTIPSVENLWKTADWQEREVYDLFGITFEGHPNLVRIMNPEDYKGHPLRKNYPRKGKTERTDFPVVERGISKENKTK